MNLEVLLQFRSRFLRFSLGLLQRTLTKFYMSDDYQSFSIEFFLVLIIKHKMMIFLGYPLLVCQVLDLHCIPIEPSYRLGSKIHHISIKLSLLSVCFLFIKFNVFQCFRVTVTKMSASAHHHKYSEQATANARTSHQQTV